MKGKVIGLSLAAGLLVLGGLVVVALGALASGTQANPPVVAEPSWDSPQTRALAQRACFDCHSNETVWPWYAQLPPASLLVVNDVNEGRRELNFSQWSARGARKANEVGQKILSGEMPPASYVLLHPTAGLTAIEKQQLIEGLTKSLK